jgi:hypothetical protein
MNKSVALSIRFSQRTKKLKKVFFSRKEFRMRQPAAATATTSTTCQRIKAKVINLDSPQQKKIGKQNATNIFTRRNLKIIDSCVLSRKTSSPI